MNIDPIDVEIRPLRGKNYNLFKMDLHSAIRFMGESDARYSNVSIVKELWATWLLAMLLKKSNRPVSAIGFPCLKTQEDFAFEARISNLKKISIERSDFDTVLFYPKGKNNDLEYYRIQIVRYVNQNYKDIDCFYRFLVKKKLKKYAQDKTLYLLIYIEEPIHFEYSKLGELLLTSDVPFANIFAIGHTGLSESFQYFGVKIYPKIEGPVTIDFEKPPPW
jgi:hypothetical protein